MSAVNRLFGLAWQSAQVPMHDRSDPHSLRQTYIVHWSMNCDLIDSGTYCFHMTDLNYINFTSGSQIVWLGNNKSAQDGWPTFGIVNLRHWSMSYDACISWVPGWIHQDCMLGSIGIRFRFRFHHAIDVNEVEMPTNSVQDIHKMDVSSTDMTWYNITDI